MAEENLSTLGTEGRDPALSELDQLPTVGLHTLATWGAPVTVWETTVEAPLEVRR